MSESIEAPKRKYTRKPKAVAIALSREPDNTSLLEASDSDESVTPLTTGVLGDSPNPEKIPQKPKRQYKKKVVAEPLVEIGPPPVLQRQTNCDEPQTTRSGGEPRLREETELIDSEPEVEPKTPREKKPRTEKQQAAFEKMRQARLAKTEELKKLKEIEREHKLLEKEQSKLNTITEKVVEKAAAIKQRKTRKPAAKDFEDLPKEPQYVTQIPEKKHREILFV